MGKIISNGIEYGGLIKVEGAMIKEIWVNDNVQPIGVFSINLDLSDYDFVGFRFEQNTSDIGKMTPIQIIKNELGATVFVFNASGGSSAVIGRSATITSTGITFSDGYVPNVRYYNNLLVPITIYGIQQGSGVSNGVIDYSTTEQKTGQKWVDGKDIYQKTIKSISSSGESLELATGVVDLVSASGYIFVNNNTAADISSAYMNSTDRAHVYLAVGDSSNTIYLNCYGSLRSKNFCITIRYTKATI